MTVHKIPIECTALRSNSGKKLRNIDNYATPPAEYLNAIRMWRALIDSITTSVALNYKFDNTQAIRQSVQVYRADTSEEVQPRADKILEASASVGKYICATWSYLLAIRGFFLLQMKSWGIYSVLRHYSMNAVTALKS